MSSFSPGALFAQLVTGLAQASSLFIVAAGLTLIFGVTRVVNFAHGSLYMLGAYVAYSAVEMSAGTALGFWGGVAMATVLVGLLGGLLERGLLKPIYSAPELLQLIAT
ncbi:MAG: ABC transporter permease, partial [Casimicrobiaceae bacterium]